MGVCTVTVGGGIGVGVGDGADAGSGGQVEIAVQEFDGSRSRPYLLLHGGGGVRTMAAFAGLLAERTGSQVLLPTHPGFGGTPKPEGLTGVARLARAYVALLEQLGLTDVTVVGNSFGGWVAAETGLLKSGRVGAVVIVDGIGIEVPGHPMADVSGFSAAEIAEHSFHDPRKASAPPRGAGAAGPGADAGPRADGPSPDVPALIGYAGPTMSDPGLAGRLGSLGGLEGSGGVPVQVIWGESDRIVDPAYGEAYAAAIPGAKFTLLPRTGHLPQVETPEDVLGALLDGAESGLSVEGAGQQTL